MQSNCLQCTPKSFPLKETFFMCKYTEPGDIPALLTSIFIGLSFGSQGFGRQEEAASIFRVCFISLILFYICFNAFSPKIFGKPIYVIGYHTIQFSVQGSIIYLINYIYCYSFCIFILIYSDSSIWPVLIHTSLMNGSNKGDEHRPALHNH